MEKITKYCETCKKDLTLNENDWSNHKKWHTLKLMKKELYAKEHPESKV